MPTLPRTVSLTLLAAAFCAAWMWWRPAPQDAPAPVHVAVSPAPVAAPPPVSIPVATPPPAVQPPALAAQVDQLIATHRPQDAMAAYRLLAGCATFNRDGDKLIFDPQHLTPRPDALPGFRNMTAAEKAHDAQLCAGMTERMRLSRLDYLAIAARAGVSGAAVEMAVEGPFGDRTALDTRPGDPLVQEWKKEVLALLTQAAEGGDIEVLEYLSFRQAGGDPLFDQNPALAYRYGVARGLIYKDLVGPDDTLHVLYAPEGELMRTVGASLSAEQRVAELAAATRIADLAWTRSGHPARQR